MQGRKGRAGGLWLPGSFRARAPRALVFGYPPSGGLALAFVVPAPPPPPPPPPPGTTPWLEEDFAIYTSTANMIADPKRIYSVAEDVNTAQMTLDTTKGYGTLTQSMRYDYTNVGCTSQTVGRNLILPYIIGELWAEFDVQFSIGFTSLNPNGCATPPDYKFVFGRLNEAVGRFAVRWGSQTPPQISVEAGPVVDQLTGEAIAPYSDAHWHQLRVHWAVGPVSTPTTVLQTWIDDRLIYNRKDLVMSGTAPKIYGIALGRNLDQGLPNATMSVWWGRVRIWNVDPQWYVFVPDFFVSPTGGTGTGSINDPWSLSYALAGAGGAITPGKQVALRGGAYTGNFTSSLNGTAANPIRVRAYPGEHPVLVGPPSGGGNATLLINGSYTWFQGFEVIGGPNTLGTVDLRGTQNKIINLVAHDSLGGNATFHAGIGGEIYGCLSYNHGPYPGSSPNAYGYYINNDSAALGGQPKFFTDNITFNQWQYNYTLYGNAQLGNLDNIYFDGNVSFGGGAIRVPQTTQAGYFLDGPSAGITLTNNHFYEGHQITKCWPALIGRNAGSDILIRGNIFVGYTAIDSFTAATVQNNTFYSTGVTPSGGDLLNVMLPGNVVSWTNNTHYRDPAAAAWMVGGNPTGGSSYNFANWKAATGLGGSDTNAGAAPSGTQVFIRPNAYETGRANIIIYNWDQASSVAVDLSSVLSSGQAYTIVNCQDFYGTPVASGTYSGAVINLPMAAITPPPVLYGRLATPAPATGPIFQVFVVRLQGA